MTMDFKYSAIQKLKFLQSEMDNIYDIRKWNKIPCLTKAELKKILILSSVQVRENCITESLQI
jgi:hypothetical protein